MGTIRSIIKTTQWGLAASAVALLLAANSSGQVTSVQTAAATAPGTGGTVLEAWACDGLGCWCDTQADCLEMLELYPECDDWHFIAELGTFYCQFLDYYVPDGGNGDVGSPLPIDPDLAIDPERTGAGVDAGAGSTPDGGETDGGETDGPEQPESPEQPPEEGPRSPGGPDLPPGVDPGDVLGPDDVPHEVDPGSRPAPSGEDKGLELPGIVR